MTVEELDRNLEAWFEGRLSPEGERALADYVEEHRDRGYDLCGTVIPEDVIPDYDPDLSPRRLAEYLEESRIDRLEDGEEPTEEEVDLFRAAWVYWAAHSWEADADIIPGYLCVPVEHSDGRFCYGVLLIRGYSFSGVDTDYHGLFRDTEAALEYVRSLGNIDNETPEPARDLIERARASSIDIKPKRARPHPVESLRPAQFERRYLRDRTQWDKLTPSQLRALVRRSLLHYGMAGDTSLIGAMEALMRRAVRDVPAERRAKVYREVCQVIESQKLPAFYAFIPVVVHEPVAPVVATATIDFVSFSPMTQDGSPAGLREAVGLVRNGAPVSPGGVFGGLVSLGDERFRPDLDGLRPYLSTRDVQDAARCESGFPSDAQIRFWLDWAEELMPLAGEADADDRIGSIASALARIRKRALVTVVNRSERLFPAHHHECPVRAIESWSLDEYAQLIGPRLYDLEADEPAPKVFSHVLEIWGLVPKAPRCERLSPPPVC